MRWALALAAVLSGCANVPPAAPPPPPEYLCIAGVIKLPNETVHGLRCIPMPATP